MGIDEYKNKVKELFQLHRASPAMWDEMAEAVLSASENGHPAMTEIDKLLIPINDDPDVAEYGHDPS